MRVSASRTLCNAAGYVKVEFGTFATFCQYRKVRRLKKDGLLFEDEDGGAVRQALAFADQLGSIVDTTGWMPRLNGKVLGLALLTGKAISQTEVVEALQVSPGAVSTAIRMLVEKGLLKPTTGPVSRRNYFEVPGDAWRAIHEDSLNTLRSYQSIAEQALLNGPMNDLASANLRRMKQYFETIEQCYQNSALP